MKRRGFLQRIASILGTAGWTNLAWSGLGGQYYQALATPPSHKLALLIGINNYPESPPLSGCLTDVELQKELLIHRFGFLSSDILTLTEEQASREFIEAAISEHLIKQVKTDDAVVFHFSGYGTRVQLEDLPGGAHALIPVDESASDGSNHTEDNNFANYLLEETLLLLLGLVPTDKVTAVLDTGYYPKTISQPSGLRFRSLVTPPTKRLNPQELNFLNHLLRGGLPINNGIAKGVSSSKNESIILRASSQPDQSPGESLFYGFSAGLFTYALTQYLWEVIPPKTIHILLSEINNHIYKLGNRQQPDLLTLTTKENFPSVLITENFPLETTGAQGVVTSIDQEGKTAQLWLGGLPPQVWLNYGVNSRFATVGGEQLVFKSSSGLTAKAQIIRKEAQTGNSLQIGQLVQETVRVLSRNINLTVALDSALERIERVDATSAFSALTRIVNITSPERGADYIFGKLSNLPARYGLFSLGGELLESSTGEPGELVKVAVQRLIRNFSQLLAIKLWRLTENQGSSQLSVKVSLEVVSKNLFSQSGTISRHLVWERETSPVSLQDGTSQKRFADQSAAVPTVPVNSIMVYRVVNFGDRPIYCMLVGLNNHKTPVAFYPWAISSPNVTDNQPELEQIVIAPGGSLQFPQNGQSFSWLLPKKSLFCEHQLIFSTSPFTKTLLALASSYNKSTDQQSISELFNPLDVTQAILEDLHVASSVSSTDSYVLDVNNWASINFVFQSV
ncbi:caspase family protein [Cylindrospermopsis curvispora]|uniref:Caspase family protein n=1 Tax=Cylindrospermopsis curvispora GIHE-G1 TaxID=2666332 RepID=A0A7H0F0T2_9CYAN|nr:caspase family protein [Cylindrospermopsis curvispora]QNP29648.1 caspase family protein [Cylindrospermopsis curvispora GIHE-G1]